MWMRRFDVHTGLEQECFKLVIARNSMLQYRRNRASALPSASKRPTVESKYHGSNSIFVVVLVSMAMVISLLSLRSSSTNLSLSTNDSLVTPETKSSPHDRKLSSFYTEFPSLRETLEKYEIVGLYFAAAWCPMSTTVTELLDDTFRSTLLSAEKSGDTKFAVVYISSDRVSS